MKSIRIMNTSDQSWKLAVRDGIKNLITDGDIRTSDCIVGMNITGTNGIVQWDSVSIICQIYVFDKGDGTGIKHYARSGIHKYINGILTTEDFPVAINGVGVHGTFTGTFHAIDIYSELKSLEFIQADYLKASRYW